MWTSWKTSSFTTLLQPGTFRGYEPKLSSLCITFLVSYLQGIVVIEDIQYQELTIVSLWHWDEKANPFEEAACSEAAP